MTFSAAFDDGWCDTHAQPAVVCYCDGRNCDHGRHSPPPDPATAGGWGDGAGVPDDSSLPPGRDSGATLHLTVRVDHPAGTVWRCHCGATFPTPTDALNGTHL